MDLMYINDNKEILTMKKLVTKVVVPSMLALSTLGIGAAVSALPASAASTAAKAPVTLTGKVLKAQATKDTFWLTVGTKTYRVVYSATTKFTKGSASLLVKGASVSATGTYAGKSTSVVKATSISA
jgi:hypothetical protein